MDDCPETQRLAEDASRQKNWKRWGPYLSERQWGTVREDYSADGDCWNYFPHDHARSRSYRWGEDGLLGWTDRECRLCFAPALWNGVDPILKERLFGLTNGEGNHGEDVKEAYFFLAALPSHAYQRALYKYPQRPYPYDDLVQTNAQRTKLEMEYEITDTDAFAENRYFDVQVEYAKGAPDDILIQITVTNHGPEAAPFHLLPTLWFRNTWAWGPQGEDTMARPEMRLNASGTIETDHATLGQFLFYLDPQNQHPAPDLLFTENETNQQRLYQTPNAQPYVKDAFHEAVVHNKPEAVNPRQEGTKAAAHYQVQLGAGQIWVYRFRLVEKSIAPAEPFGNGFAQIMADRLAEHEIFFQKKIPYPVESEEYRVMQQAQAGLFWSKQFYNFEVPRWLEGDPTQPPPAPERKAGRNHSWPHLFSRDVLSMPDTWEYPWFAAWDLAFHTVEIARTDPDYAKTMLKLLLREWYMHPNGQIPAYEFAFSDVNPPVHAWAAWRVYKITGSRENRDYAFLESVFQKLLLNFTWWVNRKDSSGRNLFSGGFLGLDNIGVFDRSQELGPGVYLEQADGTAWMGFYCLTMLAMAMELAQKNPVYEDIASKFFEHFVAISSAVNTLGGSGLWDEEDGFYYDHISTSEQERPLKVRSIVGFMPLIAVEVARGEALEKLPEFTKRVRWFLRNRPGLAEHITRVNHFDHTQTTYLLSIPSREQLSRLVTYLLDEKEFLSPHGIRAVSRYHLDHPYVLEWNNQKMQVDYEPGESTSNLFGGNSNWRGPVWFPINYLLVEALERYHYFYGDGFQVEYPTGSGRKLNLNQVAQELNRRLASLFLPGANGVRPYAQALGPYANDPLWRNNLLFHEYFHGENGRGVGASHQTGWTALVSDCLRKIATRQQA